MLILFGWNHFRIKSFDPAELGLSQQPDPNLKIEVRQHYFHFFWIPFFSLGKKWAIRKNNELYEMPVMLKSTIRERGDIRVNTPWYTFAGLLLIVVAALVVGASNQYQSYQYSKWLKRQQAAELAGNLSKFRKPTPDDYYILQAVNGYSQKYAKITRLDKQHIELSYISNPAAQAYEPVKIAALFTEYATELKTVTLSRGDSARVFPANGGKAGFAGLVLDDQKGQTYRVTRIIRLDGPVLKASRFHNYLQSEEMIVSIENEGFDTEITKVEPVEGSVNWLADGLPVLVTSANDYSLRGKGDFSKPYKVRITCTNAAGRDIQYLLEGKNNAAKMTRL